MSHPRLSEEDARRLWRRAAELQVEAARRLEERSVGEGGEEDAASGDRAPGGYALDDVRTAAVEAGICELFVRQAVAEFQAGMADAPRGTSDRLAEAFLGEGPRAIVVSRAFDTSLEGILPVLEKVLPAPPFGLVLKDSRGGPLPEGGVLVFEVPQVNFGESGSFSHDMRLWSDVAEVSLSVGAVGTGRCEVTLEGSLVRNRRLNLWVGGGLVVGAGAFVGLIGGSLALLAAAGAGLAPALVLLIAAVAGVFGLTATTVLGTLAYRPMHRYGVRKGREALEGILRNVALHFEVGSGFSRRVVEPEAPPRLG